MAAYRRVYDSRHLEADCQEPESAPELGNRVLATFTFFTYKMAAKINWHGYGTKLRHCRPTYIRHVDGTVYKTELN